MMPVPIQKEINASFTQTLVTSAAYSFSLHFYFFYFLWLSYPFDFTISSALCCSFNFWEALLVFSSVPCFLCAKAFLSVPSVLDEEHSPKILFFFCLVKI